MPRSAMKTNPKSVKKPAGVRTKPMATTQTNRPQSSKRLKRRFDDDDDRHRAIIENSCDDDNDDNDNDGDDNDDDNDDKNEDDDETSWIDRWIDQPVGERGRKNQDRRLGWGKAEILTATGITERQYTVYMRTAHRLCNRYFDVTKGFRENQILHPAEYDLIIEKMKALHPRFRFHTQDWLTRHFLISHCQVMSRAIARTGSDPDVEIYNKYRDKQRQEEMDRAYQVFKKRRMERSSRSALPQPKARQKPKKKKSAIPQDRTYTTMTQEATSEDEDMASKLRMPSRESEPEPEPELVPATRKHKRKARNYTDSDSDLDLDTNADAFSALKKVDKGKGKAVDLPESPTLRRFSTRTRRKVMNSRLNAN